MNKIVHSRKPTFTEMLTSRDLKSGDYLFCTTLLLFDPTKEVQY